MNPKQVKYVDFTDSLKDLYDYLSVFYSFVLLILE